MFFYYFNVVMMKIFYGKGFYEYCISIYNKTKNRDKISVVFPDCTNITDNTHI